MKILHCVENYHPSPGGMQEVTKQLSERLVSMGHEVTVACKTHDKRNFTELNGVKIQGFDVSGNWAGGMTGEVERYRDFLLQSNFDIFTFFAAQQFTTDAALEILPQIKGKKVSVPTGYSGLYQDHYKQYYAEMRSWINSYDMNVYLSDDYRDIHFAKENGVKNTILIPNGADEREFSEIGKNVDIRKEFGILKDAFLVLHVGNYTGRKGHKEAIEIFLRCKIKDAVLLMIGENTGYFKKRSIFKYWGTGLLWLSKMFSSKKIILTSANRAQTVAAYKEADLFLFPSQIECSPIVLFEAIAASTPFLVTDVGNSSEIVKWTQGGKVIPTRIDEEGNSNAAIKGSVEVLDQLYANATERKKLAEQGHKSWKERFTWDKIAHQYENLYKELLKK